VCRDKHKREKNRAYVQQLRDRRQGYACSFHLARRRPVGSGWRDGTPAGPLSDGVVLLRLPHEGDSEAVWTYGQDPDIAETHWLPLFAPCSRAAATRLVQEFQHGWDGRFGLTLVITTPPACDLCGVVNLSIRAQGVGEIAYGVAPQHRRRGLATRAVSLVAAWAFAQVGLRRLEICVTAPGVHGVASHRVAEKAGFFDDGMCRSCVPATGVAYEDRLYALVAPGMPETGRPDAAPA